MDYLSSLDSLAEVVEKKTIESVCSQIKDLIDKDIIKVVSGDKVFMYAPDSANIEYRNSIKFELKDKEYIQNLEYQNDKLIGENKYLKGLISAMTDIAQGKVQQ
jgi:hypothetical protein